MAKIDFDKIIRNSDTAEDAFNQAYAIAKKNKGSALTSSEEADISAKIFSSRKFRGTGGGSFGDTGIGGSGGGGSSSGGGGGIMDSIGNFAKKTLGVADEAGKFITEKINDIYKTQLGRNDGDTNAQQIADAIAKNGLNIAGLIKDEMGVVYKAGLDQLKEESKLLTDVNSSTGMLREMSQGLRDDMAAASVEAARYGYSLENIGELYIGLVENSGKFGFINQKTMESAVPVAAVLGKSMTEMANIMTDYESIGVGVDDTISNLDKAAVKSVSLGMSARKVTDTMNASMSKLNEYGFKNGIKGLEDMSRKSLEFRMNMDSVFSIAEKVFDSTSAIDFTANMQVLGGAFGDFNDPLKLMYMATNNVEGLQDALIGAAGGLATYNKEQGRFEVTSINLRKSKEMAQQMGISMGELNKIAIAAAERSSAAASLMASGLNMPEKDREFLTNISRMEGGEMKIVVPKSLQDQLGAQPIELEKLTQAQKDVLLANQEAFKTMDSKEIAMNQLTETQAISKNVDVLAAYAKVRSSAYLKGMTGSLMGSFLKDLNDKVKGVDTKNVNPAEDRRKGQQDAGKVKEFLANPVESGVKMGKELLNKGSEVYDKATNSDFFKNIVNTLSTNIQEALGSKYDKTRTINLQYNVNDTDPRSFTQAKMA